MIIFSLYLFACNDKDTGTNITNQDSGTNEHSYHGCAGQAEEQCESFSHCSSIRAFPMSMNYDDSCWELQENEYVGCGDVDVPLGNTIVYARASENTDCYFFSSTIIPDGWFECEDIFEQECQNDGE